MAYFTNEEHKEILDVILKYVTDDVYSQLTLSDIVSNIKKLLIKTPSQKFRFFYNYQFILNVLRSLCWAARYPSNEFRTMYGSDLPYIEHQSVIQYMYGKFMYSNIKQYIHSSTCKNSINNITDDVIIQQNIDNIFNTKFDDIFCYFRSNRELWTNLISTKPMNTNIKTGIVYTPLTNRYSLFRPIILDYIQTILRKHGYDPLTEIIEEPLNFEDEKIYDMYILPMNSRLTYIYSFEYKISENISHSILITTSDTPINNNIIQEQWTCPTKVNETVLNELSELHIKIMNNIQMKNEILYKYNTGIMYYSIVSLSPLVRGSAAVADMFRIFYERLWDMKNENLESANSETKTIKTIKKEYYQLDAYALSTPPHIFLRKWISSNDDPDSLFDTYTFDIATERSLLGVEA